nr:ribonuclease P protein component [Deinococcus maricopensis]
MKGDREFRKVRTHGKVVRSRSFTLRITDYRPRHGEVWRPRAIIGLIASKKTIGKAVHRNRARRRAREALRTLGNLPACRAVVHLHPSVLHVPFTTLQAELRAALDAGTPARRRGGNPGGPARVPASREGHAE